MEEMKKVVEEVSKNEKVKAIVKKLAIGAAVAVGTAIAVALVSKDNENEESSEVETIILTDGEVSEEISVKEE